MGTVLSGLGTPLQLTSTRLRCRGPLKTLQSVTVDGHHTRVDGPDSVRNLLTQNRLEVDVDVDFGVYS